MNLCDVCRKHKSNKGRCNGGPGITRCLLFTKLHDCYRCQQFMGNGGKCNACFDNVIGCPYYLKPEAVEERKETRMPEGMSLLDYIIGASRKKTITKTEFGRIMNDPNSTEEEIQKALDILAEAGDYKNLAD